MPFFTVLASAANISYGIVAVMLYKKQFSRGKAAKVKIQKFVNKVCILGLRGRQFEGGKCDVIVAVQGCAIFLMVLMFTK